MNLAQPLRIVGKTEMQGAGTEDERSVLMYMAKPECPSRKHLVPGQAPTVGLPNRCRRPCMTRMGSDWSSMRDWPAYDLYSKGVDILSELADENMMWPPPAME